MKLVLFLFFIFINPQIYSQERQVISITQAPCQFLELEGKDFNFQTKEESNCSKINAATVSERRKSFQTLKLKTGEYTFRVTNRGIPYEVGFWIRGNGFDRFLLPGVSGGGLHLGVTKDYSINLKPGIYKLSCPLNSTPDYDLVVE